MSPATEDWFILSGYMGKFFDKEGLIDTLHTMLTKGKIYMSDYRMWFKLNNITRISILTPLGEKEGTTIINGIGQGSLPQH